MGRCDAFPRLLEMTAVVAFPAPWSFGDESRQTQSRSYLDSFGWVLNPSFWLPIVGAGASYIIRCFPFLGAAFWAMKKGHGSAFRFSETGRTATPILQIANLPWRFRFVPFHVTVATASLLANGINQMVNRALPERPTPPDVFISNWRPSLRDDCFGHNSLPHFFGSFSCMKDGLLDLLPSNKFIRLETVLLCFDKMKGACQLRVGEIHQFHFLLLWREVSRFPIQTLSLFLSAMKSKKALMMKINLGVL